LITSDTWKKGLGDGFSTSLSLLKVIIPVFAVIKVLEHTAVIGWISQACDPLMDVLGLPGGSALALVTGMLFNFYAAIGILLALDLSAWQITIMAVMLSCCHELVLESAIIRKSGMAAWPILTIRLVTALTAGTAMNLFGILVPV
jgi:spore maturation protein SpmB